jgi:hypothetical protein
MQRTSLFLAVGSLVLFLVGCNKEEVPSDRPMASIPSNQQTSSTNRGTSESTSSMDDPWPTAGWVLTDELMKMNKTKWLTEYNDDLPMNRGVYGPNYTYENWHLPPKWAPYLYKNESWVQGKHPLELNRKTLFITLQGTVYLKFGVAGRDWPPLSAADIPPDATIVAEFVPVRKAVQAGIIPVFHSQPQVDVVNEFVLKALGMTEQEYRTCIGSPRP